MNSEFKFLYYKTVSPEDHVYFHRHNCFELVYYLTGSGTTSIGGVSYKYSSGSFSIILPGAYHDQKHFTQTQTIYIGFIYDGSPIALCNKLYRDTADKVIHYLLNEMKKELIDKSAYYDIILNNLLSSLLIEIGRLDTFKKSSKNDFAYVKRFMIENCTQKIDTKTLSSLTGYSYHRFRYLFKEDTGLSPLKFIMYHRVEKAKDLLVFTSRTVTAIALDCGFYDHSQFCTYFKEHTGVTPGDYRQHNSNQQ